MVQVEWDASALNRHEEWALGIAIEYSFKHAQTYLNDIQNSIDNISKHPFIGADFATSNKVNLKRLVTGLGYSIFYEVDSLADPNKIKIVSIVRGQKN